MGWRGTLRSMAAAARAAERDAERRRKLALKKQISADAADAVAKWERCKEELVSVHTKISDPIDWLRIANQSKPVRPTLHSTHEQVAREAFDNFRPRIFHVFQGGSKKLHQNLGAEIHAAKERDEREYEIAQHQYTEALKDWESETALASQLLKGEASAIREVIREFQSLSSDSLIGHSVHFTISDNFVHARPEVHTNEIVPNYRLKQLSGGGLSKTKMPAGEFNELYQDYVASVALRTASELFRILPLDEIYVTCMTRMLNKQTGHQELFPILSVQFARRTMARLNLNAIDPSDSLSNFNHAIEFKKNKGFLPITPLALVE